MILPGSYANGFAPRDGEPLYPELWRGCVGAWAPCLGPTGLTLRDWSGFGRHGVLTNMDAGTDWVLSGGKWSLDVDATNDTVAIPNIRPIQDTDKLTISFWVNLRGLASGEGLFAQWQSNGTLAYIVTGNKIRYQVGGNAIDSSTAVEVNRWYHVACRSIANQSVYINGRLDVTTALFGTNTSAVTPQFFIGGNGAGGIGRSNAIFGEFMIHNRALSDMEIRLLASRRGIQHELAPRRRSSSAVQFNRRRRLLLGST